MFFYEYIQKLMPSFGKHKVTESYEITIASIKNHTLPAYESASELFNGQKFASQFNQDLQAEFTKQVRGKRNLIEGVRDALKNGLVVLEAAQDLSKTTYSNAEASAALDFQKATLLRIAQAADFANDFGKKLLNAIYVNEAAQRGIGANMVPAQVKYIEKNYNDFLTAINFLFINVDQFNKKFKEIPQALINKISEETLAQTVGWSKLDPFTLRGFVGYNPVVLFFAERQARKYKETKDQYELLQLRMLQLQKLYDNEPDPGLEKQINIMQDRLTTLEFQLKKTEEEYNLG